MIESTILVISDDPSLITTLSEVVTTLEDLSLAVVPDLDRAYSYSSWDRVALVVIQQTRSASTSAVTRLLRMISASRRPVATLVVAEPYDADQALCLLRLGVADYLGWPDDVSRLSYLIEVLTLRARSSGPISAIAVHRSPEPEAESDLTEPGFDDEVAEDDRLMGQVRRVAPQDTTILLSGETGTGKSRLAQQIHDLSSRRSEPFITINCGSIAPHLIESEMFGQVRGSFPGADTDRLGKFAEAGRGTLFLDEIDTLPLVVQAKLLRVVEDKFFEPVGSQRSEPVQARLIAASNRMLDEEVFAGRFRSDLYYRLNVIGFNLPTLRDRRRAIPTLIHKFLAEFSGPQGGEVQSVSDEVLQALLNYDWPGNIRELRNVIERAVILCGGSEIQIDDIPESITRGGPMVKPNGIVQATLVMPNMGRTTLAQIKRDAELARITEALEKHSNNRLRAASELGISRMTLYKKLYKYGLMQSNAHSRGGVA